jgi:uncharacterized protein YheU (UPF0270 family)
MRSRRRAFSLAQASTPTAIRSRSIPPGDSSASAGAQDAGLIEIMSSNSEEPVVIPHGELSAAVLRAVIESFVNREGTDYGHREILLERKVADVMRQLERGEAVIVYDARSETVSVVPAAEAP